MKTVKLIVVLVPLAVVMAIGICAAVLADVFEWVNVKCQEWWESIYGA